MYHLVILTAMTATSGLFGGGGCYRGYGQCGGMMGWRHAGVYAPSYSYCHTYAVGGRYRGHVAHCTTGCPTPAPAHAAAPAPSSTPATTPAAEPTPANSPSATAPAVSSPPPPQARVAPVAPRVARAGYYYPSYYYSAAPACPNGNCYRR
jgi:hypothetical protein